MVDYSGGQLVATGSKDRSVRLLDLVSQKEVSPVIQSHAGSIRALLLCEQRGLLISGSYDLSIRSATTSKSDTIKSPNTPYCPKRPPAWASMKCYLVSYSQGSRCSRSCAGFSTENKYT